MAVKPLHRDDARRVIYGIATVMALLVVGLVGGIVQSGGALPGKTYTYVSADFDDIGTLKTGKEINENGLRVGTVSGISYRDGLARVTLRLDGERPVYQDASAYVGNSSALGKKFLSYDSGTADAGVMPEDGVISVEQTRAATSLEDILGVFDPETRAALKTTLGELSTGTAGHSDDLNQALRASPDMLADLQTVASAAASDDADLAGLLQSADVLVSRFDGREEQLAQLLRNLDTTVAAVGVDDGLPLETTVSNLPSTLTETKKALDLLAPPLVDARVALRTLRPGGRALGEATPSLRSFVRTSTKPLDRVPAIGRDATPVVKDLTAVLEDARPLVAPVRSALDDAYNLLRPFAPYAADTGRFFAQNALLSGIVEGDPDKHYFAAMLTGAGLFSVSGLPDPLYRSEPYALPGTAYNHATVTDARKNGGKR